MKWSLQKIPEFVDDLGLSSMEFFNLISQVEGQVHVKFTDRDSRIWKQLEICLKIIDWKQSHCTL